MCVVHPEKHNTAEAATKVNQKMRGESRPGYAVVPPAGKARGERARKGGGGKRGGNTYRENDWRGSKGKSE